MKTRVLDSWAILEWIAGRHPACDVVAAVLSEAEAGRVRLFMSAIDAGEVYYCLRKNHSPALAENWRECAPTLPVTIDVPTGPNIWTAAVLKADYPIAYADAFAAALALRQSCPIMTGDPELRLVRGLEIDWMSKTH